MGDVQQVPLEQLEIGRWYVGRGRNANVGLWDGEHFLVICEIGIPVSWSPRVWENEWGIKREPYFTEDCGCFQPFAVIDEGEVIEPYGGSESGYGYAKTLRLPLLRAPSRHRQRGLCLVDCQHALPAKAGPCEVRTGGQRYLCVHTC